MERYIDSAMEREAAVRQNPQNRAPDEVIAALIVLSVVYYGYDEREHAGQIVVHRDVHDDVFAFFAHAYAIRFPIERVIPIADSRYAWDDEQSCRDNNSSGFNYRTITGSDRLSRHALGRAFDINPRENIYVRYDERGNEVYRIPRDARYDVSVPGTLTTNHSLVVLMRLRGWVWGGDWLPESGRVDYQHFEKPD